MIKRKNKAFTMIEMMIVLAIIGIIIAIAIPSLREAKMNAELTACKASLKGVETALEFFYNKNDRYVTDEEGLNELVKRGGLKKSQIKDPWKNIWDYKAVKSQAVLKPSSTIYVVLDRMASGIPTMILTRKTTPGRKKGTVAKKVINRKSR